MLCIGCGAKLVEPSVFPGATITCACGVENVVLPPATPRPPEPTPYRDAAAIDAHAPPSGEASMLTCPFCGGPCTSEARACPHCTVELAAVRCPQCFALHFTGARFCSRCRTQLHAEPFLDASDAPCPRCAKPLANTHDPGVFECATCGGLFADHTAFAALAAEKENEAKPYAGLKPPSPMGATETVVHYVKCPVCAKVMNRINFGHRSGVIVDVCGHHGTWFDAGELTRVLEWIASGAYAAERARELAERERAIAHAQVVRADAAKVALDPRWGDRSATLLDMFETFVRSRLK